MPPPPPGGSTPHFVSSYPPPLAPRPKVPVVHFTGSSSTTAIAPSTHSILSPSTSFASPSSSSSSFASPDLSVLNTSDLRKELEALKRRNSGSGLPPHHPPLPSSPSVLKYAEEVERLKAQLSELKRKEAEMLAMQAESQRLAEEERKAAEQRLAQLDAYHRTLADASAPLSLAPSALSELDAIQQANQAREAKLKAYAAEEVRLRQLKVMAEEQFRMQRAVDVAFVVDCTSSMSTWIAAVKDKVLDVVAGVRREADVGEVRVAFVGYRDYFDAERFVCVDFTTDVAAFRQELQQVQAMGGGDIPEDMAGGLHKATLLSWRARTRSLILIADAPCHGRDFHSFEEDPRNADVQEQYEPAAQLTQLRQLHVDLCFAKITKGTEQMLERFRVLYDRKEEGRTMKVIVLGNSVEAFLPSIIATVTDSITRTRGAAGGGSAVNGIRRA